MAELESCGRSALSSATSLRDRLHPAVPSLGGPLLNSMDGACCWKVLVAVSTGQHSGRYFHSGLIF